MRTKKTKEAKLSLDQIEQEMERIAMNSDSATIFLSSQRIDMLEKVANFKIKRMQLDMIKEQSQSQKVEPITVNFTSSKTDEQVKRIAKIEETIKNARGLKEDA